LKTALARLADDHGLRARLGAGAAAASAQFAWPAIAAECAAFYRRVRGSGGAG
jgi:glycosyltransferase involved in cell wall biosynthesis